MNRLLSYCRSILPARLEAAHSASDSVRVIPSFHMSLRGDGRKKPEISLHLGCLVEKVSWKEPVRFHLKPAVVLFRVAQQLL